jgi:signal transduction histidine kinase
MKFIELSNIQFRLVASTVISALLLAACILLSLKFKDQAANDIYRETRNTSRLLLAHFEDEVTGIDWRLRQVGRFFEKIDLDEYQIENQKRLYEFLKYFVGPDDVSAGPSIFNKRGTLVASGDSFPVPELSFVDSQFFRVHSQNQHESKLHISRSLIGRITKQWSLNITRPLQSENGEFIGVALIDYKLAKFADLYRSLQLTEHGSMALIGIDGLSRIRIVGSRIEYESQPRPQGLVLPRVLKGESEGSTYGRSGRDGKIRIGYFVTSTKFPFYVISAYDEEYFQLQYTNSWTYLGGAWLGITGVMFGMILVRNRTERIRRDMEIKFAHQAEIAAGVERQNILADLHDSIGSSLTAMVSIVGKEVIDGSKIKNRLIEALTELRVLVDTSHGESSDINLALASVRYRMAGAIEQSGINLHWQVNELPQIANFSMRDAFLLKMILLEAISNTLHHSKAKDLVVKAVFDDQIPAVVVTVFDNGCGFDPSAKSDFGVGMNNIRKRANLISTGVRVSIDSAFGNGTTVRVELACSSMPMG